MSMTASLHRKPPLGAFTLVELLVTITILSLLMTLVAEVISRTQGVVSHAQARTESFQEARAALDTLTSNLSQASMDAVWAYHWNTSINNSSFKRDSDQHFVLAPNSQLFDSNHETSQAVFFQAPLGFAGAVTGSSSAVSTQLDHARQLLNCWGYYIEFNNDLDHRPSFLSSGTATLVNPERRRFRLMEFRLPAEQSPLYCMNLATANQSASNQWFKGPFLDNSSLSDHSTPIAENVLAMILVPHSVVTEAQLIGDTQTQFLPEPDYSYNSRQFQWTPTNAKAQRTRHQLPAMVQVTLVVADETSYQKFESSQGNPNAAAATIRSIFDSKFTNHAEHQSDMASVENELNHLQLEYKIVTTSIALRGAKWITDQEMP
jgi:uncharacterized protein (TIGR02599 family)